MKIRISIMPAMLVALVVAGCKQPTDPAFAPGGADVVAFEKGGQLFLRSGSKDTKISTEVEGALAWSPDDHRIAFSSGDRTSIYDLESHATTSSKSFGPPFGWRNGMLTAVRGGGGDKPSTICTVDPKTGQAVLEAEIPFTPDRIDTLVDSPLMQWNNPMLLWRRDRAYWFDGLTAIARPKLNGFDAITPNAYGEQHLLARITAKPHTHRQLIQFAVWRGGQKDDPVLLGDPMDPARLARLQIGLSYLVGLKVSDYGEVVTAALLTIQSSPLDERAIERIIDRFDLLNHLQEQHPLPARENKLLSAIVDRSRIQIVVVAGLPSYPDSPWRVITRVMEPASKKGGMPDLRIGMNRAGTKIAVSLASGTTVFGFVIPHS